MPHLSFAALVPFGWRDPWPALFAEVASPGAVPGRVVRHDSSALLVALPDGVSHVNLGTTMAPATAGDWVAVEHGAVVALLARTSLLRREDPAGGEQLLAANVDVVLIVAGLDRPVKTGRLQRAVTLAWDAGATPVVALSKADVVEDPAAVAEEVGAANPGVEVLVLSTRHGNGLEAVRACAQDRTMVLLGESGAGKSTLVNALTGEQVAATGDVRSGDAKGRHTTTTRQLHVLSSGGVVIDSPGLRAVGLWSDSEAVAATFSDIDELAGRCRFGNCGHDSEPDCAVVAAVEAGALASARLEAFRTMAREVRSIELRADSHARRRYERRFSRVAKEAQRRKGRT